MRRFKVKNKSIIEIILYVLSFGCLLLLGYEIYSCKYNEKILDNFIYNFTDEEFICDIVGDTTYEISINRTDKNETDLINSVWKITNTDNKKVYMVTTNLDGNACIVGLPKGNYEVIEDKAPDGYIRYSNKHTFTLNEDNPKEHIHGTEINDKIYLLVALVDENNIPIANEEILIYQEDELIHTLTTNIKGRVGLYNIDRNNNYIAKVRDQEYKFEIKENSNIARLDISIKRGTK